MSERSCEQQTSKAEPSSRKAPPEKGGGNGCCLWLVVLACVLVTLGVGGYSLYRTLNHQGDLMAKLSKMETDLEAKIDTIKFDKKKDELEHPSTPKPKPSTDKPKPTPKPTTTPKPIPVDPDTDAPVPTTTYKLLNTAKPLNYDLRLIVNLPGYGKTYRGGEFATRGEVSIDFYVQNPTKFIEMHSKKLVIKQAYMTTGLWTTETIPLVVTFDKKLEKVAFSRKDKKIIGDARYRMHIVYTGEVWEELAGIYKSHYTERSGAKKVAAVTQMEPTDARLMVPCFDEPNYKAFWNITIVHPTGTTAVSNGEELSSTPIDDDYIETKFGKTPRMSSYLLALIVSEFQAKRGVTKNGVEFNIYSRPEALCSTQYALTAGIHILEYYEELFGFPFPLKKNDMAAIPDFSAGAMENWGLITYRETALLVDEKSPSSSKRWVGKVVAHELAHQWFGNLVTMDWWDDLWLNEGFATFVEFLGQDNFDKNLNMWSWFTSQAQNIAFDSDSTVNSHPLFFEAATFADVDAGFDDLSYKKGAAVINMIYRMIGEDVFIGGLRSYLNKFKYDNAKHDHLWDHLAAEAKSKQTTRGVDVKKMANEWTNKIGYPLVKVAKVGPNKYELTQVRYYLSKTLNKRYPQDSFHTKWTIPVFYHDGRENKFVAMHTNVETTTIESNGFPIVNYNSTGYFRTCYGKDGWGEIFTRMEKDDNSDQFPESTRTRLYSDVFAAAYNQSIDYVTAMQFTARILTETSYVPIKVLFGEVYGVYNKLASAGKHTEMKEYLYKLLEQKREIVTDLETIGKLDGNLETHEQGLFWQQWVILYCKVGHDMCKELFSELFSLNADCGVADLASECVKVPSLFRSDAYCHAVHHDDSNYDKIWDLYTRETNADERNWLLHGLTCTQKWERAEKFMRKAIDIKDLSIKLQDVRSVVAGFVANGKIFPKLLPFFLNKDNYAFIHENLKDSPREHNSVISSLLSGLNEEKMKQVEEYRQHHPYLRDSHTINNVFAAVQVRMQWTKNNADQIVDYFKGILKL